MNEDTYRDKLTDLQLEVEALRAKLKEAQTGDTISRQAALAALMEAFCDTMIESICKDTIEALPSAQPEQRWIPCSERLPEDLEEVNVTWVNHDPEPYYNFVKDKPFTATAVYYKEKWYWYSSTCADLLAEYGRNPDQEIDDDIEITAWMPLPEPYAERREDE